MYEPKAVTAEKIDLFAKHNIRLVFHIVHPYEICGDVSEKIKKLRERKISSTTSFRCYVTRMITISSSTSS